MVNIVFATGGTTGKSRIIRHSWKKYQFVTHEAAKSLKTVFSDFSVHSVANCLTAGNLWGGFLFAHEICRHLQVNYYPFASVTDSDELSNAIYEYSIDTLICLPSFADKLINEERLQQLTSIRNIFFLGEEFNSSSLSRIKHLLPGVIVKPLAYTSQETGPLGYQCSYLHGNSYHIYEHVKLNNENDNNEIIASILYPDGDHLLNHHTGDTGSLIPVQLCKCGFRGTELTFTGRIASHYNIMGTSISIDEFVSVLSQQCGCDVAISDIQIIVVNQFELGTGIIFLTDARLEISNENLITALESSFLIREIISDSNFFHVWHTNKELFIKSHISEKLKSFITTAKLPRELKGTKVIIK
ncbi:hypothetical protein BB987_01785 [Photorhabdus temperata]|uniref:Coenzyme F390 synthetase n=1 Tax=Photorhabdus khanii NC19 TaxID=1004151 RepID=W3V6H0_9GAMM|nr:hypothetical protein [Photorhabdus khanii]ETS30624.1 coenzyme F390 synthetase [Photorhabdus khanii NC19]OHV54094.1 hypothetical protein BB987_01785 [Photorhabdus temperata]